MLYFDGCDSANSDLGQAVNEVNNTLLSHNGTVWQYVSLYIFYQYKEMPCAILLFDKADLQPAYKAYRDTLLAHPLVLDALKVNVSFYAPYDDRHYIDFRLYGNNAVLKGADRFGPLGQAFDLRLHKESPFSSRRIEVLKSKQAAAQTPADVS